MSQTGEFNKFKDEACSYPVSEGYFLKSKCYFLKYNTEEDKYKIRNKGVNNYINIKEIKQQDFESAVNNKTVIKKNNKIIMSKKLQNYTINNNKIALTSFNDKYYLYDSINGYSFGHFRITK